jgi:hypothetical protein
VLPIDNDSLSVIVPPCFTLTSTATPPDSAAISHDLRAIAADLLSHGRGQLDEAIGRLRRNRREA